MAKMRVHEIAKQLNLTSKNIISKLQELGVEVKNHMSNIEDTDSAKLLEFYQPKRDERRAEAAKNQAREKPRSPDAPKTADQQDDKGLPRTVSVPRQEQKDGEGKREDQRRDRDGNAQRRQRDGQSAQTGFQRRGDREQGGQRESGGQQDQHEAGSQRDQNAPRRDREFSQGQRRERDGQRRDGQSERQGAQRRDGQQGGQRRDGSGQRREGSGQQGGQQRREGSGQQDGQQRREGSGQQGGQQRREGSGQQGGQQRREGFSQQGGQQRREGSGQQGGQRRGQYREGGFRRDGEHRDTDRREGEGVRREGQPSLSSERQNFRRDGERRPHRENNAQGEEQRRETPAQGETGQRREGQGQRDGQQGSSQRRDGQQGGYPRRDGQQGAYPRRDGQQGGFQRRDGQQGGFQRRDGQAPTGGFQRRDGQSPTGGFQRRDGQSATGGFQRRDGQSQTGSFQRKDGQTSGFQRRDGQAGGFPKKDDGRPGFPRRDSKPPFGKKDDKKVVEQPSKDDRKQLFQKSEQARIEKAKGKKDGNQKESKQFFQKKPVPQKKSKEVKKLIPKKIEPDISLIKIPLVLTVKELAEELRRSGADVVKSLMKLGIMATVTQEIDFDTAVRVGEAFNVVVEEAVEVDPFEQAFSQSGDSEEEKTERPPVVVVMGHVDHGKTSLLDAIRSTRVTETEAGGITQHIGAYTVAINGKPITFLDTPGHEAFTAMRMRGAQVTDIAVLVVAADDGVMPQTVEAINHAKAAGVDILVAINKMDKAGANPDRVKQELTEHGILVEDWGGDTISVNVSALQRTNIDRLLEMIIIVAEMKELKANPDKPARGTIVEAQLDKGRGAVATVLVQDGTLKVGDTVVAGPCFGRIRAMMDDKGKKIKTAGPSIPAEILGLADVPAAGDAFYVAQNEKQARMLAESVIAKGRVNMIKAMPQKVSLDDLFSQIQAGSVKDLNIVLKADVQGSVEALRTSLEKLSNSEVRVQVIHGGVGAVTESDVMLASSSNAIIIGFNVRPEANAKAMADSEKVDLRLYRVIYNAIEDITAAMKGMLDPVFQEKVIGHAEIRQLFKASGVGTIGGSYVTDGKVTRGSQVRVVRDGKVVYDGTLETLRRFKDDVREVNSGYECGLLFSKFNDIKEGDIAEAYMMEEIPR